MSAADPSPQARVALSTIRAVARPVSSRLPVHPATITGLRWATEGVTAIPLLGPVRGTTIRPVDLKTATGRVVGEWQVPRGVERGDAAILYLHGGGFALGSPRTHRILTSKIAALTGVPVFSLDYRMLPRHPYPAAADDTVRAYGWLLDCGVAPSRVVVAGDSAGGHLALTLPGALGRAGLEGPAGVVAVSPVVDTTCELGTTRDERVPEPYLPVPAWPEVMRRYLVDVDPHDPRVNLLNGDLTGFPPTLIQTGGSELFMEEARQLAARLIAAGADCEFQIWRGQVHVFQAGYPILPEGRRALRDIARFIGGRLAAPSLARVAG